MTIDGFVKSGRSGIVKYAKDVHQKAQRSKTLVRSTVKKPIASRIEPKSAPASNSSIAARPPHISSNMAANPDKKIRRFGYNSSPSKPSDIHVGELVNRPKPGAVRQESSLSTVKAPPSMVSSASHMQIERLLDLALLRADNHKRARAGNSRQDGLFGRLLSIPRWASLGTGLVAALALIGFFAWQNMPQVSVRIAAARAHVSASVPDYTPAGFGLDKVSSLPSQSTVMLHFQANEDSTKNFLISQKSTKMDSSYIASSVVPKNASVQTSQVQGKTVYIYGDSNDASWIDHGTLFTIKDRAGLNSDQILRIVDSF